MSNLGELQSRLDAALRTLEEAGGAGDDGRLARLEAENRELEARLARLSEERERDLEQLDTLLSRLRPLIEETA